MNDMDFDIRVRLAAFTFQERESEVRGEVLPRAVLEKGFTFEGQRVPLISPQGIFTPRILRIPLTFCTVPPSLRKPAPYNDEIGYLLDIREDILREHDGPMLRYGLQELKDTRLHVPSPNEFQPSRDFLDIRYQEFRKAV